MFSRLVTEFAEFPQRWRTKLHALIVLDAFQNTYLLQFRGNGMHLWIVSFINRDVAGLIVIWVKWWRVCLTTMLYIGLHSPRENLKLSELIIFRID